MRNGVAGGEQSAAGSSVLSGRVLLGDTGKQLVTGGFGGSSQAFPGPWDPGGWAPVVTSCPERGAARGQKGKSETSGFKRRL